MVPFFGIFLMILHNLILMVLVGNKKVQELLDENLFLVEWIYLDKLPLYQSVIKMFFIICTAYGVQMMMSLSPQLPSSFSPSSSLQLYGQQKKFFHSILLSSKCEQRCVDMTYIEDDIHIHTHSDILQIEHIGVMNSQVLFLLSLM